MNVVPSRFVGSRLPGLAGAMALTCGLLLAPAAAPAHAQGVDVECEGTYTNQFTPALTDESQGVIRITAQNSYATCVTGLPGSSMTVNNQPGQTCVNLDTSVAPFDEIITWSDRTTSTVHWTSVEETGGGATFTGEVTSGLYTGDAALRVVEVLDLRGDNPELCPIGDGTVSGNSGLVSLTLTSL